MENDCLNCHGSRERLSVAGGVAMCVRFVRAKEDAKPVAGATWSNSLTSFCTGCMCAVCLEERRETRPHCFPKWPACRCLVDEHKHDRTTQSVGKEQWRCYVAQREQSQKCCRPSVVCQTMWVRMLGAWEVTRGLRARKWRRKGFKFEGAQALVSTPVFLHGLSTDARSKPRSCQLITARQRL